MIKYSINRDRSLDQTATLYRSRQKERILIEGILQRSIAP
ncbi:hypothetical protein HMPREF1548_02539 [Clostridium sp. KLE 1755]|nr:hypothetical protein HMPREF1548_02539 [Clostridium sp. KLE 1755]